MTESNRPPLTFAFFPEVASFEVTSDDIGDGATLTNAQVANFMGYSGENLSPQLSWSGFPPATKGFARLPSTIPTRPRAVVSGTGSR